MYRWVTMLQAYDDRRMYKAMYDDDDDRVDVCTMYDDR